MALPFPPGDVTLADGRRLRVMDSDDERRRNRQRCEADCDVLEARSWSGQHGLYVIATHSRLPELGGVKLHISASYQSSATVSGRRRPSDADMRALAEAFFPADMVLLSPPP